MESRKYLIALGLLFAVLLAMYLFSASIPMSQGTLDDAAAELAMNPPSPPPPTEADMIVAQDPNGFQLLVSYTDRGFEPMKARLKKGDTVRFTNNSSGLLWVAAAADADSALYPAVVNGCASSALDSCKELAPGEYWQFTFGVAGTWSFHDNLHKEKTGSVTVQ